MSNIYHPTSILTKKADLPADLNTTSLTQIQKEMQRLCHDRSTHSLPQTCPNNSGNRCLRSVFGCGPNSQSQSKVPEKASIPHRKTSAGSTEGSEANASAKAFRFIGHCRVVTASPPVSIPYIGLTILSRSFTLAHFAQLYNRGNHDTIPRI